jgi:hypothetical protein
MLAPLCGFVATGPPGNGVPHVDLGPARRVAVRLNRAPAGRRYHPRALLEDAVRRGILSPLDEPSLFRYEVRDGTRSTVGVVGVIDTNDPARPLLPHEETIPAEISQRRSSRTRAAADIQPIVVVTTAEFPVLETSGPTLVIDRGATEHRVTAVAPETHEPLNAALAGHPLVIADGHHRARVASEHDSGPEAAILAWVVPADGLGVAAFHRCFEHAPAPSADLMSDAFRTAGLDRSQPRLTPGSLVWWPGDPEVPPLRLIPRPEAIADLPPPARRSMAAVARHALWPLLGLDEKDAAYVASPDDLVSGAAPGGAGFLLPGMATADVVAAAAAGVLLPPKATRFRPKPARGAVIRPL